MRKAAYFLKNTVDVFTLSPSFSIHCDMQYFNTGAYLQQLHYKYKWLRSPHELIQLWVTGGVIVKHVSHAAHVPLALEGVLPLSNEPHSLGHDGVQACVLQNKLINKSTNKASATRHST